MEKRLERMPHEGAISGVCAGVGAYLNIDKAWIRIGFIASVFFSSAFGIGFLGPIVYVIMWAVLPVNNRLNMNTFYNPYEVDYKVKQESDSAQQFDSSQPLDFSEKTPYGQTQQEKIPNEKNPYHPDYVEKEIVKQNRYSSDQKMLGMFLILFGLVFLAFQLDWFHWYDLRVFWPVTLMLVGLYLIYSAIFGKDVEKLRMKENAAEEQTATFVDEEIQEENEGSEGSDEEGSGDEQAHKNF